MGFLRPYKRGVIWSFVLATLTVGATVLIPWLVGRVVDEIDQGDRGALPLLVGAIALAGVVRLAFSVARRLVAGRVSLGIEFDLRNLHVRPPPEAGAGLLRRPADRAADVPRHRRPPGRALLPRLRPRLHPPVRAPILLGAVAMFILNPALAAIALASVPFVVLIAWRFGRQSQPALQEVQQRIAELTADAEENVSGVRIVKAFAREDHQLERFRHSVQRVFDQSMLSTHMRAFYNPLIGFLPQLGLAAILLFGGRQVIHGSLSLGEFTAFYAYMLMLIGPMRMLGVSLGMAQRAIASGAAHLFQILDREPRITAPAGAPRPAARQRARRAARRDDHLPRAGEPALRDIDLVVEAGTTVALVGATGSGKTTLVALIPRLYDLDPGARS